MIKVHLQPEPSDFEEKVRKPGKLWLDDPAHNGLPPKDFWSRCRGELYKSYHGICAYLGEKISEGHGAAEIDHFKPKSKYRDQAYEWSNYRLCCRAMNRRKGAKEDILDPFSIENNYFLLDARGVVFANPELDKQKQAAIKNTINSLDLNQSRLVRSRGENLNFISQVWVHEEFRAFQVLARDYPFIFKEFCRQFRLNEDDVLKVAATACSTDDKPKQKKTEVTGLS